MEKFNIDMPDDFEINNQINIILDKGLQKQQSFYSYIKKMYKEIGFRNLFHDLSELTFLSILVVSVLAFMYIGVLRGLDKTQNIYAFIFTISPLYYLVTNLFSFINMKENNTYDIEMVCKYNLYQISALRMLVFSVTSILINTIFVTSIYKYIDVLRGIMISTTSVFLFSAILLYSLVKVRSKYTRYAVISGWVILNALFINLNLTKYTTVLENMPIAVYVIISAIAIYSYVKNIQVLSKYKKSLISIK